MPPIAAFDIDFTIHREGLFTILMYALVEHGLIPRETCEHPIVLEHRQRARRGLQRDHIQAIVDQFRALQSVKGLQQAHLIEISEQLIEEHIDHTLFFPRLLLEAVKEEGYITVAISGSPREIVQPFTRHWGFDDCLGTELHLDEKGCFSGDDERAVLHYKDKAGSLERLVAKHGCMMEGSIAIGDSMDDLPMLKKVAHPFAMNPSNELRQKCREQRIPVVIEYGDSVTLMRSGGENKKFEEVRLDEVLPSQLAVYISKKAEGRVVQEF